MTSTSTGSSILSLAHGVLLVSCLGKGTISHTTHNFGGTWDSSSWVQVVHSEPAAVFLFEDNEVKHIQLVLSGSKLIEK